MIANAPRSRPTGHRCAMRAPSGASNVLMTAIAASAGR